LGKLRLVCVQQDGWGLIYPHRVTILRLFRRTGYLDLSFYTAVIDHRQARELGSFGGFGIHIIYPFCLVLKFKESRYPRNSITYTGFKKTKKGIKMWSIHRLSSLLLIGTILQVLLLGSSVEGHSQQRSVPLSYISLVENSQIRTPSQRIHHNSEFDITFTLHRGKQEVRLSLEPNHDIVPSGAKVEYLGEDGKVARTEEIKRHEVKVFKGQSWVRDGSGQGWTHAGWARIVVHRDGVNPLFTGAFLLNSDAHHVQLSSWYMKTKGPMDPELETSGDDFMVVWKDSDVKSNLEKQAVLGARGLEEGVQCHANNLTFNQMDNPIHQQSLLGTTPNKRDGLFGSFGMMDLFNRALEKRNGLDTGTTGNTGGLNLKNTIGQTAGCPTTKQMALVGVAADCTYMAEFGNQTTARAHVITQFNSA